MFGRNKKSKEDVKNEKSNSTSTKNCGSRTTRSCKGVAKNSTTSSSSSRKSSSNSSSKSSSN